MQEQMVHDHPKQRDASVTRFTTMLRRVTDSWTRAVQINMTYRALWSLDDRTLADIGLHRSNLRWTARQVVDAARAERAAAAASESLVGRVDFGEESFSQPVANDTRATQSAAA